MEDITTVVELVPSSGSVTTKDSNGECPGIETDQEDVVSNVVSSTNNNKCSGVRRRCWEEAFASESESISPEPPGYELPLENVEGVDMCSSTSKGEVQNQKEDTSIICEAHPGCLKKFSSVREYEDHYNIRHRHKCITCKKSLPSAHILELHVLEAHDTLFSLMAERKPMLACFLESCSSKFWKPEERKDHCLAEHGFPKSFKMWDLTTSTSGGNKPEKKSGSKQSTNGKAVNKQNQKQKNKNQASSKNSDNGKMEIDPSASNNSGPPSEFDVASSTGQGEEMETSTSKTVKNAPQKVSTKSKQVSSEKTKNNHEKSTPLHFTFGHSVARRAFKPNYAFGMAKPVVPEVKGSKMDNMDLSDIKDVLPTTTGTASVTNPQDK